MPFSHDELLELPNVISAPRFATYLQAIGNDREKALELYDWNLSLSAALIVPLQVCEVAGRNGIAEAIEAVHGATWPWTNGFIRSLPRPKRQTDYNPVSDLTACAARLPTTGKIVADLKFAFWEKVFTRRAGQPHLGRTLPPLFPRHPDRPVRPAMPGHGSRQSSYHSTTAEPIAHHEPIFTRDIPVDYQRIHDMIAWRSQTAAAWMDNKQSVLALLPQRPADRASQRTTPLRSRSTTAFGTSA